MAKILIVFYSRTGNTRAMAEAVEAGVKDEGVEVTAKRVQDVSVEDLPKYDGIIVGSPTYYGLMASEIKKLIDESVRFHGQMAGKVGGAFAASANVGGGNETTIMAILQAMLIHGMVVQGSAEGDHYGPVAVGKPDERAIRQARELGKRVARLVKKFFG